MKLIVFTICPSELFKCLFVFLFMFIFCGPISFSFASAQTAAECFPGCRNGSTCIQGRCVEPKCFPECRSGFICHNGECISLCNPPCRAEEQCTTEATCIPRVKVPEPEPTPVPVQSAQIQPQAEASTSTASTAEIVDDSTYESTYHYDRMRFGLGAGIGIGYLVDFEEIFFPFGVHAALSLPLGSSMYLRGDVLFTYASASKDAEYRVGSGSYEDTYLDMGQILIALRPAWGYMFNELISMRLGGIIGAQKIWGEQGMCGSSYKEMDSTELAIGGSAAISFTTSIAEFSMVADVVLSEAGKVVCSESGGYSDRPITGDLIDNDDAYPRFMATGTYLF